MRLLYTGTVFPRRKQTCVRDHREQHHLGTGRVGTQLLIHTLLCPDHLWGTKIPPLPSVPCPESSARFPAILTCCGGRSHTRCCTWCRQCRRLASNSLGKLPRPRHPSQCRQNTGCNQPASAAQNQPQRWLPHGKKPPCSLPPSQPQRLQLLPRGKLQVLF